MTPDSKMQIHEERDRERNPYSAFTKEQEPKHDDYSEDSDANSDKDSKCKKRTV